MSEISFADSIFLPESNIYHSLYSDQESILMAIKALYCPEGFECDITYGNGGFWRKIPYPKLCFDKEPLKSHVKKVDSAKLPLKNDSLNNIVFDPPFLTYIKAGRQGNNSKKGMVMAKRFGGYWSYDELENHYKKTLLEACRVLKPKGKLIFKCQDIIHNHKMHCTHVNVIGWAKEVGLELKDLFILSSKNRFPSPNKTGKQQHARINHCYFLVLEKIKRKGVV